MSTTWQLGALSFVCGLSACQLPDDIAQRHANRVTHADASEPAITLPDVPPSACSGDGDCAHIAGCCFFGACQAGVCVARARQDCCSVPGPCASTSAQHTATCTETCVVGGCERRLRLDDETPCDDPIFTIDRWDDAAFASLMVTDTAADRVSWHLTTRRTFQGHATLALGDPLCPTYYSGPLDASCEPIGDPLEAGAINASVETPRVTLPGDAPVIALVWLWLDLEPDTIAAYDILTIGIADPTTGAWLPAWTSAEATPPRATWFPVAIDLSAHAGTTVALRVAFDTLDGRDNHHEGVYVGPVRVATVCAGQRDCPAEVAACETTAPITIAPTVDTLCLQRPIAPGRPCATCVRDDDCAIVDACDSATCSRGICEVTRALDAACCTPASTWPDPPSFEAGLSADWQFDPPLDANNTAPAWHVTTSRSQTGVRSLRFGDLEDPVIAPPGVAASGTIWSPLIGVPPDDPQWRFSVFLATEWDAAPSHDNPAGIDLLEALVHVELGPWLTLPPARLWGSDEVGGTTLGDWVTVVLPLHAFQGHRIRLGWRFSTGDESANDGEGAFIDDALAVRRCPPCESGDSCRDTPTVAP